MCKTRFFLLMAFAVLGANGDQVISTGSGFAITSDGYLLTNAHVVAGCARLTAKVGGLELPAEAVSADGQNDLALVKIAKSFSRPLTLRDRARVELGEPVVAFGYPLQGVIAGSLNMTTGNVSSLSGLADDTRSFQFTAPVQPGNSGGPLVDNAGSVVGVVTSKLSPLWVAKNIGDLPQNVNFAMRTSVVQGFLESRGVTYVSGGKSTALTISELTARASYAVVALQCFGTVTPEATVSVVVSDPSKDISQILDSVGQFLEKEMITEAEARLRVGIAKYAFDPDLREELAKLLIHTGRTETAIGELRTVLKLNPTAWHASALLAAVNIQQWFSTGNFSMRANGVRSFDELVTRFTSSSPSRPESARPSASLVSSWKYIVDSMRDPGGEWTAVMARGTGYEKSRSFKVFAKGGGSYSVSPSSNESAQMLQYGSGQQEEFFAFVPWDLEFRLSTPQSGSSPASSYFDGFCTYQQSADIAIAPDGSSMTIAGKITALRGVSQRLINMVGKQRAAQQCGQRQVGGPALYITLSRAPERSDALIATIAASHIQTLTAPAR